ncbi:MAG: hypothetical protein U5N26_09690 [Candidatus Marinimicrobia bacterium]|nr:hypothetical protein [Candidatus Neomarinimicrobiota bacterium]
MHELDPRQVQEWLRPSPIQAMKYPDTTVRFVDWIEKGVFNTESLIGMCEEQWSKIPIPHIFRR